MTEPRAQVARDIVQAAHLTGDFVLSSGARSTYYLDKYLFETQPTILRPLAALLAERVPADVDRVAGPELGAVALATALSLQTGLPFVIVRKSAKDYGTSRLVEGELDAGERVLVVEDIISSGAQAIHAARQVQAAGAEVVAILGVIDREQGGPEAIAEAGFAFDALYTRTELGV